MRLTLDIDSWWFTELQRVINTALELGLPFPDTIRPSPSRKGYHIIWYGLNITEDEVLKLRLKLGDDIARIFFDIVGEPKQVLFTKKRRWK